MKRFLSVLFVSASITLSSCGDDKLDKIDFVDGFDYVQKNIIEFDSLHAYSNYECGTSYSFEFLEEGIIIEDYSKFENGVAPTRPFTYRAYASLFS